LLSYIVIIYFKTNHYQHVHKTDYVRSNDDVRIKKKPKPNHRLTMMWSDFYKDSAIRLRDSSNQESTAKEITNELLLKCGKLKDSSTVYHFKLTRRHARDLGTKLWLPQCPQNLYKCVSALGQSRVAIRIEDPLSLTLTNLSN